MAQKDTKYVRNISLSNQSYIFLCTNNDLQFPRDNELLQQSNYSRQLQSILFKMSLLVNELTQNFLCAQCFTKKIVCKLLLAFVLKIHFHHVETLWEYSKAIYEERKKLLDLEAYILSSADVNYMFWKKIFTYKTCQI